MSFGDYKDLSIPVHARQHCNADRYRSGLETGLCAFTQCRPGRHDIVDQENSSALYPPLLRSVDPYGPRHGIPALLCGHAVQFSRRRGAFEQVGEIVEPIEPRNTAGQQGGLIVTAVKQPTPMQGHRGNHGLWHDQRGRGIGKPISHRMRQIRPISMFEPQHHSAGVAAIEHHRPSTIPWFWLESTIITKIARFRRANEGASATLAGMIHDERRLRPAFRTQAAFHLDQFVAGEALWRVDQFGQPLHFPFNYLDCAAQT